MDNVQNNYVVGRGRLFFGQFVTGTRKPRGQLYFGNTPELSTSQNEDKLDHYSSEGGIRVKDASITLQNDATGSFQCDNISGANLALWFRGDVINRIEAGSASAAGTLTLATAVPVAGDKFTVNGHDLTFVAADPAGLEVLIGGTFGASATNLANTINEASTVLGVTATVAAGVVTLKAKQAGTGGNAVTLAKNFATPANGTVSGATLTGGADVTETITNVQRGMWYQLGVSDDTPQGVRNTGNLVITDVDDASFTFEPGTGRFYLNLDADDVVDGQDIEVSYGISPTIEEVVIAKGESIEGELLFLANNAAGDNRDYYWPYTRLTPDGDFALKGDDWQAITFNFEILLRDSLTERQYITKR